ncbi:unnamed protein product [Darwinula stevensoni]|uniref:tRNA pseudouridine synthase n=1 Tax=Darwinula stevensoni TaxID=69355 RepID=A0A7R8X4W5_9CRUS|nr:unnamed protein product [Darwinula stevensoni]CAG0886493.1 unnamed protein product [Darwinula stevensoni]
MVRYLAYFGYIGTYLRGIPKVKPGMSAPDYNSVQGLMEQGLLRLQPVNEPHFYASSRTDQGVHALCSTGHFDLEKANPEHEVHPDIITFSLNKYFDSVVRQIRKEIQIYGKKGTVRMIHEVSLSPGQPFLVTPMDPFYDTCDYWNVKVKATGFLYKQVRRMVGTLVAVGKGKIGEEDVKALIDVASSDAWPSSIITAPPGGLYLVNVEYDPASFETGWSPKYGPMDANMEEESDEQDLEDEESSKR